MPDPTFTVIKENPGRPAIALTNIPLSSLEKVTKIPNVSLGLKDNILCVPGTKLNFTDHGITVLVN